MVLHPFGINNNIFHHELLPRAAQSARQCCQDSMQRIFVEPNKNAKQDDRHGVGCGHAPFVERQSLAARVQKKKGLCRASQLHHHGAVAKESGVAIPKEPHRQPNSKHVVGHVFFRHGGNVKILDEMTYEKVEEKPFVVPRRFIEQPRCGRRIRVR